MKMGVKTKNAKNMIVYGQFCSIWKRHDRFCELVKMRELKVQLSLIFI